MQSVIFGLVEGCKGGINDGKEYGDIEGIDDGEDEGCIDGDND